jgi:hypothetical protein
MKIFFCFYEMLLGRRCRKFFGGSKVLAGEVEACGRMGGGYASRFGVGGGVPETM